MADLAREGTARGKGWTTFEIVKLRIIPNLEADQRESLRMDYDLAGDTLELRVGFGPSSSPRGRLIALI